MRRLRYLASAQADILAITGYLAAEAGVETAARFVSGLRQRCRKLADLPGQMGRARTELRDDIRSSVYGNYVIFFRYLDDRLEIVNVIEGHRDIESLFADED